MPTNAFYEVSLHVSWFVYIIEIRLCLKFLKFSDGIASSLCWLMNINYHPVAIVTNFEGNPKY